MTAPGGPADRPATPWPHPADLDDLEQVVRFRTGGRAKMTVWMDRKSGTEHFLGSLNDPRMAEFAVAAMNDRLASRQGP